MSLIPSESLSFPDSFRATIGWRPLTEEERRRSPSVRPASNGTSNGAEAHTTNGQSQAPSQPPREDYKVEAGKPSEPTTEQATFDLGNEASQKSVPVSDTPAETIPAQSPPVASEAKAETESPEAVSAEPTESKEETKVAAQLSITEIFQKIAEAQGQLSQPESPAEAKIELPPMAGTNQTESESPETSAAPLPGPNEELSETKSEAPVGVQLSIAEILRKIAEAQSQSLEPKTNVEFSTAAESDKKELTEKTPSPPREPDLVSVSESELPGIETEKSSRVTARFWVNLPEWRRGDHPRGRKLPPRLESSLAS